MKHENTLRQKMTKLFMSRINNNAFKSAEVLDSTTKITKGSDKESFPMTIAQIRNTALYKREITRPLRGLFDSTDH